MSEEIILRLEKKEILVEKGFVITVTFSIQTDIRVSYSTFTLQIQLTTSL